MTVSLCGSSAGLTGRLGVVRAADGRVGVVRVGVRVTGLGIGASSSEGEGGRAGVRAGRTGAVGTTFAPAESSSGSAEGALKLRVAKSTTAAIKIVFADFITTPFISPHINMVFLHNIIGKSHR